MADWNPEANAIFLEALDLHLSERRRAYLDQACGDNTALRGQVEALLAASERAGSFLEKPAVEHLAAEADWPAGCSEARAVFRFADEGTGTRPSPVDLGETRAEQPSEDEAGQGLDFLGPSQQPGSLGRLGHYEVLEVVGRGGMGVVLRAFDEKLHRVVAIKAMARELATSAAARKRFTREAKAAAAVRDEHVIDIHAVEESGPVPYLVMEYVRGVSLQERIDQAGPLELKEILRIGMQVASGLAAAHAQGLVHRDIKPANILLENGVERVKITDFGLARAVDDASLTQRGVIAGTPQYMSPEQAEGKPVDHRSDLFSLASVLYAMCAGRAPFRASTTMAVLRRVCDDMLQPIREINSDIPEWLCAIIGKLHAKDPADRLQSAVEVVELLGKHLAQLQQPLPGPTAPATEKPPFRERARGPGLWVTSLGRGRHWPVAAALLLLVGLGMTEAAGVTRLAATVIHVFTPEGTLVVEVDDPNVKVTVDGEEVSIQGTGLQEIRLRPGQHQIRATKDGKAVREELVTIFRGRQQLVRVSLHRDPQAAVLATDTAEASQAATQRFAPRIQPEPRAPERPGEIRVLQGHRTVVGPVACSADGQRALSGGWDGAMVLWKLETGRELHRFAAHTGWAWSVAFSPDGRQALSAGSFDKTVCLWDLERGQEVGRFHRNVERFLGVAFMPGGPRALSDGGGEDNTLRLWDVANCREIRRFEGHTDRVSRVAFSADGRRIVSGGRDKIVRLWDAGTGAGLGTFEGHVGTVLAVACSSDGRRVVSGSEDGTVRLWEEETGKELRRFEGHAGAVEGVALAPDGRWVLSGGHDQTLRLWDVETGKELCRLEGHTGLVAGVAFTPDGRRALSSGADKTVRLWRLPN